jgi:hypothetical protein
MRNWTYAEFKSKVENDLGLQADTIIEPDEMLGYMNDAIDEAEAEIHKLGVEDEYFLARTTLPLTTGEDEYDPPSDLYANKIKAVLFNDGSRVYPITRMRKRDRFEEIAESANSGANDDYQYLLVNNTRPVALSPTTGRKIVLVPPARETSSTLVTVWYIRNAAQVTDQADIIDIPEFAGFLLSIMKGLCRAKENGGQLLPSDVAIIEQQRKLMIDTLTEMVPDGDTEMEPDTSHYQEHT